ncbi:hypothetical protein [Thermosporothrix hazakensis]|uniref:hypothetical protein n=1 Tax=Thermosporothrix hazakensis TaxID=644383 RepID=UPI0011B63FB7|nr:hypothetical protein [Thermosporothrix hazakensis]
MTTRLIIFLLPCRKHAGWAYHARSPYTPEVAWKRYGYPFSFNQTIPLLANIDQWAASAPPNGPLSAAKKGQTCYMMMVAR